MKKPSAIRGAGTGIVLAAIVGIACYFAARATGQPGQDTTSGVTPFTYKAAVYFYGSDPAGKLADISTLARRSDGTTVHVLSAGPLQIEKNVYTRTIRYIDGSRVKLLDAAKVKSSYPPSYAAIWRRSVLHPPPNCVYAGEMLLQENGGKVLGQAVVEIRPPAPPGYRIEAWAAPGLACQVLTYHTEMEKPDGTYQPASEKKALSLQIGEPDPRLFAPGNGYTEMPPSEFGRRLGTLLGLSASFTESPSMARADHDYNTLRGENPDWEGH